MIGQQLMKKGRVQMYEEHFFFNSYALEWVQEEKMYKYPLSTQWQAYVYFSVKIQLTENVLPKVMSKLNNYFYHIILMILWNYYHRTQQFYNVNAKYIHWMEIEHISTLEVITIELMEEMWVSIYYKDQLLLTDIIISTL